MVEIFFVIELGIGTVSKKCLYYEIIVVIFFMNEYSQSHQNHKVK